MSMEQSDDNWLADAWGENPLLESDRARALSGAEHSGEPSSDEPQELAGDFPEWHPAALGFEEDRPEENTQGIPQPAGYDTEPVPTRTDSTAASGSSCLEAQQRQQQKRTGGTRRYNPERKRGFRRPPACNDSDFAPAIGAVRAQDTNPQHQPDTAEPGTGAKAPRNKRLFRTGSALNEELTPEEESLIRGIAADEKQPIPGMRVKSTKNRRQTEQPDPYTQAKTLIYNQLAYSAKSREQLRKKLESKGFEADLIEPLLNKFEAAHLIDDAEYARSYVVQRGTHKKLSRAALRRELKERGITGQIAEEALKARTEQDERRDAAELVRKKLRPSMNFSEHAEKDKIMRRLVGMLARRGYSSSVAFAVVKEEMAVYEP